MVGYKKGDFAKVQGQLVKIIDIRLEDTEISYKVKIVQHNNKFTHWVVSTYITPINSQKAPKILFGTPPRLKAP